MDGYEQGLSAGAPWEQGVSCGIMNLPPPSSSCWVTPSPLACSPHFLLEKGKTLRTQLPTVLHQCPLACQVEPAGHGLAARGSVQGQRAPGALSTPVTGSRQTRARGGTQGRGLGGEGRPLSGVPLTPCRGPRHRT